MNNWIPLIVFGILVSIATYFYLKVRRATNEYNEYIEYFDILECKAEEEYENESVDNNQFS